jgi:hypothetical protein
LTASQGEKPLRPKILRNLLKITSSSMNRTLRKNLNSKNQQTAEFLVGCFRYYIINCFFGASIPSIRGQTVKDIFGKALMS